MAYPSQFSDLYNEVIAKVRLDSTNDLQKVKDWINQVYSDVVIKTEALQDYATMSLTSGQSTYTLSSSVVRIKQMYVTPSGGEQSRPLVPTSVEQILEWSASNGATTSNQGSVTHYATLGLGQLIFYPTPTAADTVTVYYVKQPTALSSNSDVPSLPEPYSSDCLVNGACFEAALFLKDPDASIFKQLYDSSVADLRAHLRRMAGSMTQQFRITRGDYIAPHDPATDIR